MRNAFVSVGFRISTKLVDLYETIFHLGGLNGGW